MKMKQAFRTKQMFWQTLMPTLRLSILYTSCRRQAIERVQAPFLRRPCDQDRVI